MHLIVDVSNLCWIKRFGHFKSKKKESYAKELIVQEALKQIVNLYKYYQCSNLVLAFDGQNTWRKQVYPAYKATRDVEFDLYYDEVKEAINQINEFFEDHTNCYSLKVDGCEADDVIAVVARCVDSAVILSTDSDFNQLLSDNIKIYNPIKKKEVESENPDYELFLKCIRGDRADNILSAYPRVRETRLKEAFNDPYKMLNLLNEKRKDDQVVHDVYERNRDLIDLSRIPKEQTDKIYDEIRYQQDNKKNYSYAKVLRYFRDMKLKDFFTNQMSNHVFILKNKKEIV